LPRAEEPELINLVQEALSQIGVSMTFESGSNVTFHINLPGACMKEQSATHSVTSVGSLANSTVGAIGATRDVSLFTTKVVSSHLPDDAQQALKNAYGVLEALSLNLRSKKDVADYLEKVTDEAQQPQPDENRLKHLLAGIKDLASPVASALSMAASLAKLLGK
jgi:hypothetical protein